MSNNLSMSKIKMVILNTFVKNPIPSLDSISLCELALQLKMRDSLAILNRHATRYSLLQTH
jgi:hypothetical protein